MKKTITLASVLCACAAHATEYTFTNNTTSTGMGAYGGWVQALDASTITAPSNVPDDATLYLSQVQVRSQAAGGNASSYVDSAKLAVYAGTGASGYGTFLGLSDAVTNPYTTGQLMTFTFDTAIEWSTTTNGAYSVYKFVFVDADTTVDEAKSLVGATSANSDITVALRIQIDHTTPAGGSGVLSSGGFSWNASGYGGYANYVMTDVAPTTAAVPEPTTATLSLLALAGLAARRRRK